MDSLVNKIKESKAAADDISHITLFGDIESGMPSPSYPKWSSRLG